MDSWEQNLWPILYDLGVYLVATQLRQLKNIWIMNLNLLTILCKLLSLTYYSLSTKHLRTFYTDLWSNWEEFLWDTSCYVQCTYYYPSAYLAGPLHFFMRHRGWTLWWTKSGPKIWIVCFCFNWFQRSRQSKFFYHQFLPFLWARKWKIKC